MDLYKTTLAEELHALMKDVKQLKAKVLRLEAKSDALSDEVRLMEEDLAAFGKECEDDRRL